MQFIRDTVGVRSVVKASSFAPVSADVARVRTLCTSSSTKRDSLLFFSHREGKGMSQLKRTPCVVRMFIRETLVLKHQIDGAKRICLFNPCCRPPDVFWAAHGFAVLYSYRLLKNIAIDITAIVVSLAQIKRDLDAQKGRLARMEIGAKLAGLKVRLQV